MKIPLFIKALARICDKESSRYALGGIECKSDGTTAQLTATDGRILATVHYPDGDGKEFEAIVAAKDLSNGPAATYKQGVHYDGKCIGSGKDKVAVTPVDGRFPDCEKVLTIHDSPDGYATVTLDAELLGKLCALADGMNDKGEQRGITLYVKDQQSCVFAAARSQDGHVARLAIMPRAVDDKDWKPDFPARPGAVPVAAKKRGKKAPAPVPECLDDDAIAEAVTREPVAVGDYGDDLPPI